MHTVELIDEAVRLAIQAGFSVRQEWLGGSTAGVCQVKGRPWIFVDLAMTPSEQLALLIDALAGHPRAGEMPMSRQLQKMLVLRKPA